jgi:hypothetical protein
MVMVKITILTMTIDHKTIFIIKRSKVTYISTNFNIFDKKICNWIDQIKSSLDGHDQIWIDHFDYTLGVKNLMPKNFSQTQNVDEIFRHYIFRRRNYSSTNFLEDYYILVLIIFIKNSGLYCPKLSACEETMRLFVKKAIIFNW